jgi:hypothetical protein
MAINGCACSSDLVAESKLASMTNAAMIATGIEITRRIFSSTIYEFTADLRAWNSESNTLLPMRKTRNSPAAS